MQTLQPFPLCPRYTLFHKICHLIITFSAFRHPCKGHQDHLIHGAGKPPGMVVPRPCRDGWKSWRVVSHTNWSQKQRNIEISAGKLNYTWSVCSCCSLKKAPNCGDTCVGTQVSNKQLIVVVILLELFRQKKQSLNFYFKKWYHSRTTNFQDDLTLKFPTTAN